MKIKRCKTKSIVPSLLNFEGVNAESIKRMFLIDVSTSHEKDIVASVCYSGSETSEIAFFYRDYDAHRILPGAFVQAALHHQQKFNVTSEYPIRLEKTYRFLKRGFDFTKIQNEVMKMNDKNFVGMNIYTHQIKVYSNVPPCVLLELAEICNQLK